MSKNLKINSIKIESNSILNGKKLNSTFEMFFDEPVNYLSKEVEESYSDLIDLMMKAKYVNVEELIS